MSERGRGKGERVVRLPDGRSSEPLVGSRCRSGLAPVLASRLDRAHCVHTPCASLVFIPHGCPEQGHVGLLYLQLALAHFATFKIPPEMSK